MKSILFVFLMGLVGDLSLLGQNRQVLEHGNIQFPLVALQAGSSTVAVFGISVNSAGTIDKVVIISGDPLFIRDCVVDVKKWKFIPGKNEELRVVYAFGFVNNEESERIYFDEKTLTTVILKIRPQALQHSQ
jgi:hypothetical protein